MIKKWVGAGDIEEDDGQRVFFLTGLAGTGKSTIAHSIASFFNDEGQTQVFWQSPCHADIIYCPAHRQASDVPAREAPRGDDEAVGGKYQFLTAGKDGAVPQPGQGAVVKCGQQDGFDELGCLQTAAPVVEGDAAVADFILRHVS